MWIETIAGSEKPGPESVTPHAGVWIETNKWMLVSWGHNVTPHAGVLF